jgi:hypothetical protein
MSQTFSFHAAEQPIAKPARSHLKRSGNPGMGRPDRATRRRKQPQAPARVPMLDWPRNLFSDNASTADLMAEEFPLQWDMPALSQNPEIFLQAAA